MQQKKILYENHHLFFFLLTFILPPSPHSPPPPKKMSWKCCLLFVSAAFFPNTLQTTYDQQANILKKVSEYNQEIPQLQTADQSRHSEEGPKNVNSSNNTSGRQ